MPLGPTISTALIMLSAIIDAFGWRFIIQGKVNYHKRPVLSAAIFALLFLVTYVSRTIIVGNTSFGGPEDVKIYYTIFLVFHIVLATTSAVFGVITLRLGLKRKIERHRKLGPIVSVMWFITATTGVLVYLFLYVFSSGGETTGMLRAIFGF